MSTVSVQITKRSIPIQWMKIGTALITLSRSDYLIVEIVKLRGTTLKHVIDALKSIMARFGIPKIVFSDNAPQFSSAEFRSFSKFHNFQLKTSSPEYTQSNSRAEKAVQIAKRLMKRYGDYRYIKTMISSWTQKLQICKI